MTRPTMPERIKRCCLYLNMAQHHGKLVCAETGLFIVFTDLLDGKVHFDHNPPLALRDRISVDDKDPASYKPHANDPDFIDVVSVLGHKKRTNEKRGLYRGDLTEIAHGRRLRKKNVEHQERMETKAPKVLTAKQVAAKAHRKRRYDEAKAWKKANRK